MVVENVERIVPETGGAAQGVPTDAAATAKQARRSGSQPILGILHRQWPLFNGEGREALDLEATSLLTFSGD